MKRFLTFALCGLMIFTSCGNMSNLGKGSLIGTGAGAALGAGVGALIGNKMDKKAAEMAALEGAQVEIVKDINGLDAIKVTFDSGILFATNKSNLGAEAQKNLAKFADVLKTYDDADVAIYGHTDNTGKLEVNQRISKERADAVANFLKSKGVAESQIKEVKGFDYQQPVADNSTAEGRAQNRRVEVFLFASDEMREAAEAGTLE